jgi:hypothetical protein
MPHGLCNAVGPMVFRAPLELAQSSRLAGASRAAGLLVVRQAWARFLTPVPIPQEC